MVKIATKAPSTDRQERFAVAIAHHFGFRPIDELTKRKDAPPPPPDSVKEPLPNPFTDIDPHAEEVKRIFTMIGDRGHLPPAEPLFLFWHPRTGRSPFALGIIGTPLPIAEALLIKIGHIIASGGKDDESIEVSIGSMGDKDSAARFAREALSVVRRHEQTLPRETRLLMRDNAFRAIRRIHDDHPEIASHLPSPTDFLSDKSRVHFRDVLHHLEESQIPYMLRGSLFGQPDLHSDTLFEIRRATEGGAGDTLFARGARYDEYLRKLARQRMGGAVLFFAGKNHRGPRRSFPRARAPFVFFIHIGQEARQRGIGLMESLRGLQFPVRHALGTCGFREQLEKAESLGAPFAIIMGQKEAQDGIVIVRNMETREQDYIPTSTLPKHLTQLFSKKRR